VVIILILLAFGGDGLFRGGRGVTEITPELLVFATTAGNVVASVGPDGALHVGTPTAASTT